ncbi:MAG: adenosyl-hopene transferase HpnH [Elusimicrobiota bacterium]
MPLSARTQLDVFSYILSRRLSGNGRYPLVMMLEPLFACNLECAGCGKVQQPPDVLQKRLSPDECFAAAEECGAPIVAIAGGEPLMHPQMPEIVSGFVSRGKNVYLCTNAILLERELGRYSPSPRLVLSIHLDGPEKVHDRIVGRPGVFRTAMAAIRKAKAAGLRVMTNTTVYQGESSEEFRAFFDELVAAGIDGMMISPGYPYEAAAKQDLFLQRGQTQAWFRETLRGWRKKGWPLNHSPFYLDFLRGARDYDCTPWGNPVRSIFGWQRPCYLLSEGAYAATYKELLETTDWGRYGRKSGHPKCAHCMLHCGYEPSAVIDMFSTPAKFMEMLLELAGREPKP